MYDHAAATWVEIGRITLSPQYGALSGTTITTVLWAGPPAADCSAYPYADVWYYPPHGVLARHDFHRPAGQRRPSRRRLPRDGRGGLLALGPLTPRRLARPDLLGPGAGARPGRRCRSRSTARSPPRRGRPPARPAARPPAWPPPGSCRKLSATSRSTRATWPPAGPRRRPGVAGRARGASAAEPLGHRPPARVEAGTSGSTLFSTSGAEVEALAGQRVEEQLGLVQRRRLQGGDDHERGAPVVQQPLDRLGPLRRSPAPWSGTAGRTRRCPPGTASRGRGRPPGRRAGWRRLTTRDRAGAVSHAQQPAGEEVGHPVGRLEEVEGVAGRRRVHHDQVVAARRVQLVQPLHGDVLVALDEPAGDVLVQLVVEDAPGRAPVGGVARTRSSHDCLVSSMAAHSSPRGSTPAALNAVGGHPASRRCRAPPARGRRPAGGRGRR